MDFTFEWYKHLLKLLSEHGYHFTDYHNWKKIKKPVILRHDIDNDLSKALEMAELEATWGGGKKYIFCIYFQ